MIIIQIPESIRQAFENHVLIWWRAINRDSTGKYVSGGTEDAWELWKAAQAAMPVSDKQMPMTEDQMFSLRPSGGRVGIVRAVEAFHGISARE